MRPMCTVGEDNREVDGRDLLGPRPLVSAAFTVAFTPFGSQHFFQHLADSVEHGAAGRQKAAIEREALVDFFVEFLARRQGQVLQVQGEEFGCEGRQSKQQRLAAGDKLYLVEEPRIAELLGASFAFTGIHARVRLEASGSEQLLLRVLSCALKTDRRWRSFLLRQQGCRTKQKQSDTGCGKSFNHLAPRLANQAQFSQCVGPQIRKNQVAYTILPPMRAVLDFLKSEISMRVLAF